jgi:hypothetical protein
MPRRTRGGVEVLLYPFFNLGAISALWLRPRPGHVTLRLTRYALNRGLGGPQDRSGRVRKISLSPGIYPRAVHPVTSRYTDCAIPAHER